MIEINERLELEVPAGDAWVVLSDPHEVVSCIPGAELISENEDGSYDGKLLVQFGPMRVGFKARVVLTLDDETHSGTIEARGKDNHGATKMRTEAQFAVEPNGGEACVVGLTAQVHITGRLASQIESGAGVVVRRMTGEFTTRFMAKFSEPVMEAPISVPSGAELAAGAAQPTLPAKRSLWARIKAFFRRNK